MKRIGTGALFAAFVFCMSSGAQVGPAPAPAPPPASVRVLMTDDLRFSPETITISAGDSVRWLNASRTWHTVTTDYRMAKDPKNVNLPVNAEPFNSGKIDPGGTWSYQFMLPGTYRYFCIYHEEQGMVGEIVVSPRVTGQ